MSSELSKNDETENKSELLSTIRIGVEKMDEGGEDASNDGLKGN